MPITFLGTVNGEGNGRPEHLRTVTTYDQIKNESNRVVFAKPLTFHEKLMQSMQAPQVEKTSTPVNRIQTSTSINNDIIKPKYLQDKSVVYKSSGYVRDLLGEGN